MKEKDRVRVLNDGEDGLPVKVILANMDVNESTMGLTGSIVDPDFATDVVDGLGSTNLSIVRLDNLEYALVIPTICLKQI